MALKHKKNPLTFQGENKNNKYFEGWYFKQVSSDLKNIISIIPGISKNDTDSHSFIQVIISRDLEGRMQLNTQYYRFFVNDFKYMYEPSCLIIGDNVFSDEGIKLNLSNDEYSIQGSIRFSQLTKIKRSIISPDAMGYFSYLPFMECYHDIISMNHRLEGVLTVNGEVFDLNKGRGYIEKDFGTSFPKEYIWLQSNHFGDTDASIMFSLAHIPFLGFSFKGFICNFTFNGREYRFATYNNSKAVKTFYSDNFIKLAVTKGKYFLVIKAEICRDSGGLKAPVNGAMDNIIKEGLTGSVDIRLLKDSKVLFAGKGNPCAIEFIFP